MKLEKLPSGSYRVRKTYKKKTYTLVFEDKSSKKEIMQAIAEEIENEKARTANMTFRTAANNYIELKQNILSPSTIREYTGSINRLSEEFKEIKLSDITALDVQKEINRLAKEKSPKTVRNYHGFISAVLGTYRPNLILHTTLPQKVKNEPYIPSEEDVKKIIKDIEGSMFEIPILLACYGLRRSEILALTLDDLTDNILTINKAKVQDENGKWVIKTTKTTESTRAIAISPILADKIRKQGFYLPRRTKLHYRTSERCAGSLKNTSFLHP